MESAKYLREIKRLDSIINSGIAEMDAIYAMITRITPVLKDDVVTGSGNADKIGNAIAKLVDMREELNRDVDKLVDKKREASALLKKLQNPLHYEVLHKRYVMFETFEQIALEIGKTYRWVCVLHGRALQAFDKILQENKKENHKNS